MLTNYNIDDHTDSKQNYWVFQYNSDYVTETQLTNSKKSTNRKIAMLMLIIDGRNVKWSYVNLDS
jgi:hypothetical protein